MADDVKLEILLQAKNQSEAAFNNLKGQLTGLQQEIAKTSRAVESGFNFERTKSQLVAFGVSAYAAFQAIGKAVDMAEVGAKLEKQAASFENLSQASGTSGQKMLSELRTVSRGMISDAELIGAAGKAMLMGISPAEITKLMEIAAATSRMTGQTMTEAFADITMGVARQSKMILDNLGIIVDADKAYKDYAATLGKTADALTDTEKRAAFMNAVMKSGEDMIKRLGTASGELEGVNKLVAAQANLWAEVQKTVASILNDELSGYAKLINWIDEKLKDMRQSRGEVTRDDLLKEIEMLRSLESKGMAQPGTTSAKMAEYNRRYVGRSEAELADRNAFERWYNPDKFAAQSDHAQKWIEFTADDLKAMAKEREKYLEKVEDQAKKEAERIARIWADYKPRYAESQRSEAELADEKTYDAWKKSWEPWAEKQRLPESQRSEAELADEQAMAAYKEKLKKEFNAMTELSQETARAMQANFSDLFFDAMTGELDSFEDYATAIFRSIQKAFADMASQMLTQKLFGSGATGATSGGGGWIGELFSSFGGSGPEQLGQYAKGGVFAPSGMVPFARGGIVDRPTVFPFARGAGLMGEDGPEAIMPLSRDSSGRLGVKGGGNSVATVVNVNNYTGQQVQTKETRGPGGTRQIEIMIGQMITGDGPASRAMQQTYGLTRKGAMRG